MFSIPHYFIYLDLLCHFRVLQIFKGVLCKNQEKRPFNAKAKAIKEHLQRGPFSRRFNEPRHVLISMCKYGQGMGKEWAKHVQV